ncbi:G-protein coupled receptor family C group 6 member A-like [Pristis pectinata]|uniref:G-protein coupled receptor family C group 6 member A-like n=1 Tax=Pristis pectinata TaxID=685728 RepID=UPI00223CA3DF|nr:G-protein coupled receptor family C group 6 member A-like [Pristis pectinata]XP_051880659.1 G-protein coupled receptor family C group 6 member A-like [Pristis pectinata]
MFTLKAACAWCWVFLCFSVKACNVADDLIGAKSPGDIVIGGLFPVHQQVKNLNLLKPDPLECTGFDVQSFIWVQAMIHTIDMINNSSLLNGIKLGYEIYDTCSDASKAIIAAMKLLSKSNSTGNVLEVHCNYTDYKPIVKAVVGEVYSELSIPTARIFNVMLMPQISFASSASILSNKGRFASFLRTVPSDIHQTKALAKLVSYFKWNWVGVIATDDEYGTSAMTDFISHAQKQNVCIGFQEEIPTYVCDAQSDERIQNLISKIENTPNASVIVLFAKQAIVVKLFNEIIHRGIKRLWIASDAWSMSRAVAKMKNIKTVGNILGFSFKTGCIPGFLTHLRNLRPPAEGFNKFIDKYKQLHSSCPKQNEDYTETCSSNTNHCLFQEEKKLVQPLNCDKTNEANINKDDISHNIELGVTYAQYLATKSIAEALRNLLKCREGVCQKNLDFPPWKLLEAIRMVNFTEAGRPFYFDESGDSINGYDLIHWDMDDYVTRFKTVGEYKLLDNNVYIYDEVFKNIGKAVFSNCSRSCKPGERKNAYSLHTCCYDCVPCAEGYHSAGWDMNDCLKCLDGQWSDAGSSECNNKTIEYFNWNDGFAIVLVVFASLGIVLIIVIIIIFSLNLNTPAVKSSGGYFCFVILFSLFLCFISTGFFIGEPTNLHCKIRQPLFGISFTICVSWILIKSFRIILAFNFDPIVHHQMKKMYKPLVILVTCTLIQVIICTLWLLLKGPFYVINHSIPKVILPKCDEGSNVAFGIMLGYIAFLAFLCFLAAFMGRKIPDIYNEARFITFSMLIYLIVWISFVPVHVNTEDKYLPAVEVVAILASNYGILCCHFFPKCYFICFKKDQNTPESYRKNLREHNAQKRQGTNLSQTSGVTESFWSAPESPPPVHNQVFQISMNTENKM